MKLSPMILQGLWEFKSPFLQLPFVTDDHLRLFMTKKRHIKNLQQFAQLKLDESRHILKHLTDFEYENVIRVLGRMPLIDFSIRCEGKMRLRKTAIFFYNLSILFQSLTMKIPML